jgi:hypothetical protein
MRSTCRRIGNRPTSPPPRRGPAAHAGRHRPYGGSDSGDAGAGRQPIDPRATATAILSLVDAAEPPLRLFLGTYPYPLAEKAYAQRLHTWRQWHHVAASADDSPSETGSQSPLAPLRP